ncbi:MAG TPA: hypothetical protein VFA81_04440 [Burkholderiales bacterium]|nr:hypothetical protein [Burkholderiales bacterium]
MKRTTILIAALAASNVVLAGVLIWQQLAPKPEIYVDHLEDLRLSVETDGLLRAQLGDSRNHTAVHLAFTPHGALQFHHEMGRMFVLIEQEAAKRARDRRGVPRSPDRSL